MAAVNQMRSLWFAGLTTYILPKTHRNTLHVVFDMIPKGSISNPTPTLD